jgi:hypothetical protein
MTLAMSICLVLFAAQIVAALIAFVRERGEDPRFAGDKLIYRS